MRDTINFKKELEFKNNIAEITSISLECNYEAKKQGVEGSFLIEGSYRSHEISLNQETFSFKVPFDYQFAKPIIDSSALVNVKDFTYTIESNNLNIDIEYETIAEEEIIENDFLEKEEFDRFLTEHEVEVVDLNNVELDERGDKLVEEKTIDVEEIEETILPPVDHLETEPNINIIPLETEEDIRDVTKSVIENIATREDTYITYHVYLCTENDSIESISSKFKINIDTLKSYNDIDSVTAGMKLIIPSTNE